MNISRIACLSSALLALSCAESSGTVSVDATYNLTCPDGDVADCGSYATPPPCLSEDAEGAIVPGRRSIVGVRGDTACTGDVLDVRCEAVDRPDGRRFIALEAFVGDEFAFKLDAILGTGSVEDTCVVTITEDETPYGGTMMTGGCGTEPPSPPEQPCQISNVSTEGGGVAFDIECEALLSSTSGFGFDVGAVGGGPTTIRFGNCTGF